MHPSPDAIALLAMGENPTSAEERLHIDTCTVCAAQIEELARVVELGRLSDEDDELETPDPAVWQRIRAELFGTPAAPVATVDPPLADVRRVGAASPVADAPAPSVAAPAEAGGHSAPGVAVRRTRALFALVAAVALIAGLGLGFGVARMGAAPEASAAIHLNGLPSWPGAEGEARVDENEQGKRVLIVSVTTPQPVDGKFEVWLSDDKALHMRAMGTMNANAGTFEIPDDMSLDESPVIDVSLEPKNDPDPEHSKNSVVRGRLRI